MLFQSRESDEIFGRDHFYINRFILSEYLSKKLLLYERILNERYSEKDYVYGEKPNTFFAGQLDKMTAGSIILPCEGEGRNAVYALQPW